MEEGTRRKSPCDQDHYAAAKQMEDGKEDTIVHPIMCVVASKTVGTPLFNSHHQQVQARWQNMSKSDSLLNLRAKTRYIFEIRYQPWVQFFDNKGSFLEKIFPEFKNKIKYWKVEEGQILMSNDFSKSVKQISVGHMSASISYEDPGSRTEFIDDTIKLLSKVRGQYPHAFRQIDRAGFRVVSIFASSSFNSFSDVMNKLQKSLLSSTFPSTLEFNDFKLTLDHPSGKITIGPCKQGELWVQSVYNNPTEKVPELGIGLDVDSYITNLDWQNEQDFKGAVSALQELSLQSELEIMTSFKLAE